MPYWVVISAQCFRACLEKENSCSIDRSCIYKVNKHILEVSLHLTYVRHLFQESLQNQVGGFIRNDFTENCVATSLWSRPIHQLLLTAGQRYTPHFPPRNFPCSPQHFQVYLLTFNTFKHTVSVTKGIQISGVGEGNYKHPFICSVSLPFNVLHWYYKVDCVCCNRLASNSQSDARLYRDIGLTEV
jgi:hypothetical protein